MEELKYEIPESVILDGNSAISELLGCHEIEGVLSLQHCTSLHHLPHDDFNNEWIGDAFSTY